MSKSTTIKRILKEASELSTSPSPDYHAAPLETNLFEWHFTIRGPPSPSPFTGGIYHGRIILPPAYPLRPPSFRFLTPSGRFEVNREICLSISGHHEETWQPAWGVRTALVAIRSLMDEEVGGQVGGMGASAERRVEMAGVSGGWECGTCGRCNREILEGQEGLEGEVVEATELVGRVGLVEPKKEGNATVAPENSTSHQEEGEIVDDVVPVTTTQVQSAHVQSRIQPVLQTAPQPSPQQHQQQQRQQIPAPAPAQTRTDAWIDKAIIGIVIALAFMCLRKYI